MKLVIVYSKTLKSTEWVLCRCLNLQTAFAVNYLYRVYPKFKDRMGISENVKGL